MSSLFCMYILAFYEIDQAKTLDLFLHQEQRFVAHRVNFIPSIDIYVIQIKRRLSDKFREVTANILLLFF